MQKKYNMLEITGKLVQILPLQTGSGKNGAWQKQEFILETTEQYPKKVCISAWGDKVDTLKNIPEGASLKGAFNIESREFNSRWNTDIRAWKIDGMGQAPQVQSSPSMSDNSDFPSLKEEPGDLPF